MLSTVVTAAICLSCRPDTPVNASRLLPPSSQSKPRSAQDAVAARVDGAPIFASEVARQAATEGVTPHEAVQTLISVEALANAALKRRLHAGGEAYEAWKQILAQAWLTRVFEPEATAAQVPMEVLREVYERNRTSFDRSRMVRIAILDLYAFPKAGQQRRQSAALWAAELMQELRKIPHLTLDGMRQVARNEKWLPRQLKFGVEWQGDNEPYSKEIGKAVMALREWGEITPVVEDAAGFHIAMYIGERAALHQTFEQALPTLRESLSLAWGQRHFRDLTDAVAHRAGAVIAPEALVRQTLK